jgi:hypothetical protein
MLNSISKKAELLLVYVLIHIAANFNAAEAVAPMDSAGFAIEFDGTNDYITITSIDQAGITGPVGGDGLGTLQYTAECWFKLKPGNEGQRQALLESTFYTMSLEIEPSGFYKYHVNFDARTGGSGYINVVTDVKPIPDTWHHAAVTVDARNNNVLAVCYYDGEIISYSDVYGQYLTEVGDHVNIGANRDRTRFFKGAIDEVRIWNKVRTQEELQEYMYKLLDGNEPGLAIYHRFDHAEGDTSKDMTSNHYDGVWGGGYEGYTEPHWVPSGAMSKVVFATKTFNATDITETSFTANWKSAEGVTKYFLDVATDNEFIETVSGYSNLNVGDETSYTVTNLTPGTNYYYRVSLSDTLEIKSNTIYCVTALEPPGNALRFDGENDYVDFPVKNFLGITGPGGTYQYTVEGWFKLDPALQGTRRTLWQSEENYTMSLEIDEYGLIYYVIGSISGGFYLDCEAFTSVPVFPDEWTHIALVVDNSSGDLLTNLIYNGELVESFDWPGAVMQSLRYHVYFGTYREHDDNYFIGSMDEVRIWNVSRTEEEIRNNMKTILTGTEAGLTCYYRFDHNSGDQLYDYSPNGNHGVWRGISQDQESPYWMTSDAFVPVVSAVDNEKSLLPNKFSLQQNFPNPFNSSTTFNYELPEQAHVSLVIYDLLGKMVATLANEEQDAGLHRIQWDAMKNDNAMSSTGVYFVSIKTKSSTRNYSKVVKMLYLK